MLEKKQRLFRYKKIYDHEGSETLFVDAVREAMAYHQKHNHFYAKLLKHHGFMPHHLRNIQDIGAMPTIPVDFFKTHEIRSIPKFRVAVHATSSGTQGQKSQVFLSRNDLRLGTKMAFKSMAYHKFLSPLPTNYLLLGYEPKAGNDMGNVKVLLGMTKLAPAKAINFALKDLGGNYQIDFFGILATLKRYNRQPFPVRIFGFPSYLYMMLTTMKKMGMAPLNFGKRSVIFTGGGWKKFDNMKIDQDELHHLIETLLGIPKENCRDFYSAVEHSVAYPECPHHHMHVPIWSRVIIRDMATFQPVGYDTPGFLSFVSPLVSGMPLTSVTMGDMAILREGASCGCGITTPYFEILGRAGTASGKSCAMTATDLQKGLFHGPSI